MYFASNQRKQHAFDKYFNAMARSNFKQGRKLRALIKNEADDAAMTDKLASIYASSLAKGNDYEYDSVSSKLKKKVSAPVEETPMPVAKAKRAYVQNNSDSGYTSQAAYESSTEFVRKLVNDYITDRRGKPLDNVKPVNKKDLNKQINNYLKQQGIARQEMYYAKRNIQDDFKRAYQTAASLLEKRDRSPQKISPNDRAKKKAETRSTLNDVARAMDFNDVSDDADEADEADEDPEIKQERELKKINPAMRRDVHKFIDKYTAPKGKPQYGRKDLQKALKQFYKQQVDIRKGDGYFEANIPKTGRGGDAKTSFESYKEELKGWLDGVFI